MLGVWTNTIAIVAGSLVGLLFRRLITEALGKQIQLAFGFITLVIGLRMAMEFKNIFVFLACITLGGILGSLLKLERRIENSEKVLQRLVMKERESTFATGLSIASILFCVGGMAIVGPIQGAVTGNHEVLFTKSLLDGVTSAVLAGLYGIGVIFSALPVLLYQGSIALLAERMHTLNDPRILSEVSGVGGVLIAMIGVNLARISRIPVGDFLPAILLVLVWAFLAGSV